MGRERKTQIQIQIQIQFQLPVAVAVVVHGVVIWVLNDVLPLALFDGVSSQAGRGGVASCRDGRAVN